MAISEGASWARSLLTDTVYRRKFAERLNAGELAPMLEKHVWEMAYGKATEHSGAVNPHDSDFTKLSLEELSAQLAELKALTDLHIAEDKRIAEENARIIAEQIAREEAAARAVREQEAANETNIFHKVDKIH